MVCKAVQEQSLPQAHSSLRRSYSLLPARVCRLLQDIAEDQQLLARLVHNMQALEGDADGQYDMLVATQVGIGALATLLIVCC